MTDNDLIRLFLPIIQAGLTADGFVQVITQSSNQPRQQGIPSGPTVFFTKIHDKRYGWLGRFTKQTVHTETQWHETVFQVIALSVQNPLTPEQYSAANLVNEVASILQSENTHNLLIAQNVGIYRISEIRNPWFQDDRDQFEASPTFDFTLTHLQTRVNSVPVISSYDVVIDRI